MIGRSFAVVVPTLNAGEEWKRWMSAMELQTLQPSKVLIIDSDSDDQTAILSKAGGYDVHRIDRACFNHGATRQLALELVPDAEILVYLTQDAILSAPGALKEIVLAFEDESIGAAYGRQLPRSDADHFEKHARLFNYPPRSRIQSVGDIASLGMKTVFISNSFSAYRASALNSVGGFPADVIVSEDMYVAAQMISRGWAIAYCAEATVEHSHAYTPWQEFQRYFDVGVFHGRQPWIMRDFGSANGEGIRFIRSEIAYLGFRNLHRLPESVLRIGMKYIGFSLGRLERRLPNAVKRKLSMQKWYWR